MVNPLPISSPQAGVGLAVGVGVQGVGVGVGVGIQGVNVSALVREAPPSSPPAAMITLLPEMNAPDANERAMFKFAEVVHWSEGRIVHEGAIRW